MKKDFAVVIGRFQPFHVGHKELINHAFEQANEVIVVLGSANSCRTIKNPWTFEERIEMIKGVFPQNVTFVGLRDYHYSDEKWMREVRNRVYELVKDKTCVLVGHKKDTSSYYLDLFPEWEFCPPEVSTKLDATEVRKRMFEGDDWLDLLPREIATIAWYYRVDQLQFEYDFIDAYKKAWKDAPYAPTFLTVDNVINDDGHILLIRRKDAPGKGLWALPGGFVNPTERLDDAALRELNEETGVMLTKKTIVAKDIFDYPSRSLRGRTITTAFYHKTSGIYRARANDDADKAFWVAIPDVYKNEDRFFEDHFHIICKFIERD